MIFCSACGQRIHESAATCPGCGAIQPVFPVADAPASTAVHWMSVASSVLGGLCLLATFDDSRWSKDQVAGFLIALATSAALGLVGLGQKTGTGPAIAGVALSALALILFVGML